MFKLPRKQASGETAARHLDPDTPLARPDETAADLRLRLRLRQRPGSTPGAGGAWSLLCVVDAGGQLLGTLSAAELLALPDDALLAQACHRELPCVPQHTDQERLASIALQHGALALPLMDEAQRLVGVVGPAALMDVLRREHVEDLHRLAGVMREGAQARHALEDPPLRRARHRLPWLLLGLLGSVLATWLMSRFEAALALVPAVAFFVPGVVYLADAVGTQSEAVAVRGLSLSHAGLGRLLGGELRTGLLVGLILGLAAFGLVQLLFDQRGLALAVAVALMCACTLASLIGLLLPWLLGRLGLDPAYGSGPLATILQDLLSLLVYLGCVSLWVI